MKNVDSHFLSLKNGACEVIGIDPLGVEVPDIIEKLEGLKDAHNKLDDLESAVCTAMGMDENEANVYSSYDIAEKIRFTYGNHKQEVGQFLKTMNHMKEEIKRQRAKVAVLLDEDHDNEYWLDLEKTNIRITTKAAEDLLEIERLQKVIVDQCVAADKLFKERQALKDMALKNHAETTPNVIADAISNERDALEDKLDFAYRLIGALVFKDAIKETQG